MVLTATVAVAACLGLLIGSFLNVVIHRVPEGVSVVTPPSACPSCGARIRAIDNVPVLSWLRLRGRCRDCGARISWRYPAIELATGLAFALVALGFAPDGLLGPPARLGDAPAQLLVLVAYLVFAAAGIALTAIDVERHRLPTPIIVVALIGMSLLLAGAAAIRGDLWAILTALLAALASAAFLLVIVLIRPDGMGLGDVRLALVTGLAAGWVGWPAAIVGLLAAFLLGAIVGVGLIIARRGGRRTAIAFGPWLLAGAWVGILAGPGIWSWYQRILGLA